jgi:hypothetical protein
MKFITRHILSQERLGLVHRDFLASVFGCASAAVPSVVSCRQLLLLPKLKFFSQACSRKMDFPLGLLVTLKPSRSDWRKKDTVLKIGICRYVGPHKYLHTYIHMYSTKYKFVAMKHLFFIALDPDTTKRHDFESSPGCDKRRL